MYLYYYYCLQFFLTIHALVTKQRKKKNMNFLWKWKWSLSVFSNSLWPHGLVAYQASPSMGFSRQEHWSGLPFRSPGDLPDPGIKPRSPTLQADALTSEPPGKPHRACAISIHIFEWRCMCTAFSVLYPNTLWTSWYFFTVFTLLSSFRS